eukprot:scaffold237597_cov37-Tisochrysis_lutea.AAC.1
MHCGIDGWIARPKVSLETHELAMVHGVPHNVTSRQRSGTRRLMGIGGGDSGHPRSTGLPHGNDAVIVGRT